MIEMSACLNTFSHMKIHLDTFGTKLAENNHGKYSYKIEMIQWLREWVWIDFWSQKPGSGHWDKVASQCANGDDNPSPAKVERSMLGATMAALMLVRVFLALAGQVTIPRGREISCRFNVRSPLLQSLVLHQKEEAHMLGGARFPLCKLHPPSVEVKQ